MRKLFKIVSKNFRILARSRTSALIVFLGPLFLILLIGLAFNNAAKVKVNIAVYSPEETDLMNNLLDKFIEKEYSIITSVSQDECIENVRHGTSHTCLVFPEDFEIRQDRRNELQFYVDYAEINLVYMLIDMISERITEEATGITEDLTTRLVKKIEETKLKLGSHRNILLNLNLSESGAKRELGVTKVNTELINLSLDFRSVSTSTLIGKLNELEDTVDDVEDLIEDIGSECSSESCLTAVAEAKNSTALLLDELGGTSSDNETQSLYTTINNLATSLYALRSSVDTAEDRKGDVVADIDQAIEKIEKNLIYIEDLFKGTDVMLQNLETLRVTNATVIAAPIKTSIKSVSKEVTHFNFLFPLLIVMVIMTTSILFSSTLVMNEKKSKAFFRNFVTPTSYATLNIGIFFTALIIILLQVFIFLLVAGYFFKVDVLSNLGMTSLILFIISSSFILIGMFIGSFFRTSETNTLAAITLTSIFLFFSKTVLPLESMPEFFRNLAGYNPLVISTDLLKKSIFFKIETMILLYDMRLLLYYIVGITLLMFIIQRLLRVYLLFHMHKKRKLIAVPGAAD